MSGHGDKSQENILMGYKLTNAKLFELFLYSKRNADTYSVLF